MAISESNLANWFTYHVPSKEDQIKLDRINSAALAFAKVVIDNTPPSADQSAAIRHIREARMTANASVMCRGV